MTMARSVRIVWSAFALTPLLLAADEGFGRKVVAVLALYVIGWILLVRAVRRDSQAHALRRLWTPGSKRELIFFGLTGLQAAAFFFSGTVLLLFLFLAVVALIGLWTWSGPTERFARTAGKLVAVVGGIGSIAVVGEIVCRLPPVAARTGGASPGMARWESDHYDRLWLRNPLRLRSQHLEIPKPPGTFRILALGDSFTWGDKIAHTEDTWPSLVEADLVASGRSVQAINLAERGYTTANEAESLARLGWLFEPDLVIVQFCINDTLPSSPDFQREDESWYFRLWPLAPGLHEMLDARSYLYSLLNSRFRSFQMSLRYPEGFKPLFADGFFGWDQCRDALEEIGRETRNRGVPALLVVFPSFDVPSLETGSYPYAEIHGKIRAAAQASGIAVLDLWPIYASYHRDARKWWALPCDHDPGIEAQHVAARAIAKEIGERDWVKAIALPTREGLLLAPKPVGSPETEGVPGPITLGSIARS